MRPSLVYLTGIATLSALFLLLPLHAGQSRPRLDHELSEAVAPLKTLQMTDLCLTSEARYTRHPALADRHAPFQEHPASLEHFPSGSLILPVSRGGQP